MASIENMFKAKTFALGEYELTLINSAMLMFVGNILKDFPYIAKEVDMDSATNAFKTLETMPQYVNLGNVGDVTVVQDMLAIVTKLLSKEEGHETR